MIEKQLAYAFLKVKNTNNSNIIFLGENGGSKFVKLPNKEKKNFQMNFSVSHFRKQNENKLQNHRQPKKTILLT